MSHTLCPLCSAEDETMDHLTMKCTYAAVIWAGINARLGVALPSPDGHSSLAMWWPASVRALSRIDQKTANSLIMLVIRAIWLERNARVFEGQALPPGHVLESIIDEWSLWALCRCRMPQDNSMSFMWVPCQRASAVWCCVSPGIPTVACSPLVTLSL